MAKFLVIDTETGGLDANKHSILSLAGVVWEDGVQVAECEVLILEDVMMIDPQAIKYNQIDLTKHIMTAVRPFDALQSFLEFVDQHFEPTFVSANVVLAGHNIALDIAFMRRLYGLTAMPVSKFDARFSHRKLDTASQLQMLYAQGKIPLSATSSDGGFEHFGIHVPKGKRHTALGDARATAELLTKLVAFK